MAAHPPDPTTEPDGETFPRASRPKGVLRDNSHAVALQWTMDHFMGIRPGETYFAASDIGWVVGHSYICYGPLLHGCTTVLFEGKPVGTPDAAEYWRVVARHSRMVRVAVLAVP